MIFVGTSKKVMFLPCVCYVKPTMKLFFPPNTIYLWSNIILYLSLVLVFGVEPDLTREGGSIPVTLTFQEATGKNVMLLPVGSSDDGAHSQNEKLNR